MKRIGFDPSRCSFCGLCAMACSLTKQGRIAVSQSRIRLETAGDCRPLRAAVCAQCEEPACVTACMRGIIDRDEASGLVTRRTEDCFRCAACAVNCPAGACMEDEVLNAFVSCDLCGGDPLCVRVCPEGALRYEDDAAVSAAVRISYAQSTVLGEDKTQPNLPDEAGWEKAADLLRRTLTRPVSAKELERECLRMRRQAEEEGLDHDA